MKDQNSSCDIFPGKQFMVVMLDRVFFGINLAVIVYLSLIFGLIDVPTEAANLDFVIAGFLTHFIPNLFGYGTFGAHIAGAKLMRKDQDLSTSMVLIRSLLYFYIFLMVSMYSVFIAAMMGRNWPFDPLFQVRLIPKSK